MEPKIKNTTAADYQDMMDTMREGMVPENSPEVGFFWYNPERDRLVGVTRYPAVGLPFNEKRRKTVRKYHHLEWPVVREDAIANGSNDAIWQEEDYTQVPRGRVFEVQCEGAPYFEIMVGAWINEYPSAKRLVLDAFHLRGTDYDFVISVHWGIGHGTSEFLI